MSPYPIVKVVMTLKYRDVTYTPIKVLFSKLYSINQQ